jgi:hypothetical protein
MKPVRNTALLIALQTPYKGGRGVPTLLWGKPGQGKTSFLESLARPGFHVETVIGSIHDPTDFSGLPVFQEGKVKYAPPEWADRLNAIGEGLLVLDELTTSPPSVQAALLRVVLERTVGATPLSADVRVVAAANHADMIVGGWELSPPLRNRFIHLDWELSVEEYRDGILNGFPKPALPEIAAEAHAQARRGWGARTTAFLEKFPQLLNTSPENDQYAFASPRSWEFAIALMASCEVLGLTPTDTRKSSEVLDLLLKGSIGKEAAIPFFKFVNDLKLPDADALLRGTQKVNMAKFSDSDVFVLFEILVSAISDPRYGEENLLPEVTMSFCDLAQQVSEKGRKDVIFAALRKAVRTGIFEAALLEANQRNWAMKEKVREKMESLFDGAELAEYVELFS